MHEYLEPSKHGLKRQYYLAYLYCCRWLALFWAAVGTDENIWQHLLDSVLPNYIVNSLILMTGVCLGVTLVGTCTAWLIANCRFPGHKVFGWMLILPLAMPAYVMAYVYTDFLEYSGHYKLHFAKYFPGKIATTIGSQKFEVMEEQ